MKGKLRFAAGAALLLFCCSMAAYAEDAASESTGEFHYTDDAGNVLAVDENGNQYYADTTIAGTDTEETDTEAEDEESGGLIGDVPSENVTYYTDSSDADVLDAQARSSGTLIDISSTEFYDTEKGMYLIKRSAWNGAAIYSNIMNGMVTDDIVTIEADQGLNIHLYTSGVEVTGSDFSAIRDPGSYTLTVAQNGETESPALSFNIVDPDACNLAGYAMPNGFSIDSVTLDGEDMFFDSNYVDFTDEGRYVVNYHSGVTEETYILTVNIDHTAPTLELAEVNQSTREAKGPVSLKDAETGSTLQVYLDGQRISTPASLVLNSTGHYTVIITDAAGNSTQYNFQIGIYFNVSSVVIILLVLAIMAVLLVYLFRLRTHVKIR